MLRLVKYPDNTLFIHRKSNPILNLRSFWWFEDSRSQNNVETGNHNSSKVLPSSLYLDMCSKGLVTKDEVQLLALRELDSLQESLSGGRESVTKPSKGIYFYGGVGRGKTMMMDLFYNNLHYPHKARYHFHSWMLDVHKMLHNSRGQKDPLENVAIAIAQKSKVLCMDEFEITDVADAFVIRWLFERLWKDFNVVTVFTSNTSPDRLYFGGINRSSFLPFVSLLKERCKSVSLDVLAVQEANDRVKSKAEDSLMERTVTVSAGRDYRSLSTPLEGKLYW